MFETKEQDLLAEGKASPFEDASTPQSEPDSLVSKVRREVSKERGGVTKERGDLPEEGFDRQPAKKTHTPTKVEFTPNISPSPASEELAIGRDGLVELSLPQQRKELISNKEELKQGEVGSKETVTPQKARVAQNRESFDTLVLNMMRMIIKSFRALLCRLIGVDIAGGKKGASQDRTEALGESQSLQSRIEVISTPRKKRRKQKKKAEMEEKPQYKLRAQVSVGESVGELRLEKVDDEESSREDG